MIQILADLRPVRGARPGRGFYVEWVPQVDPAASGIWCATRGRMSRLLPAICRRDWGDGASSGSFLARPRRPGGMASADDRLRSEVARPMTPAPSSPRRPGCSRCSTGRSPPITCSSALPRCCWPSAWSWCCPPRRSRTLGLGEVGHVPGSSTSCSASLIGLPCMWLAARSRPTVFRAAALPAHVRRHPRPTCSLRSSASWSRRSHPLSLIFGPIPFRASEVAKLAFLLWERRPAGPQGEVSPSLMTGGSC